MDYTSIHIYGHLLSDDILHHIERENTLNGNRDQDFGIDISVSSAIDYVWSSLRNDWNFYKERANNERLVNKDPYGTRRARDLMERLFQSLGYSLDRQATISKWLAPTTTLAIPATTWVKCHSLS